MPSVRLLLFLTQPHPNSPELYGLSPLTVRGVRGDLAVAFVVKGLGQVVGLDETALECPS